MIQREAWYREASTYQERLDALWERSEQWDSSYPEVQSFRESLNSAKKFFDLLETLDPSRKDRLTSGVEGTLAGLEHQADLIDRVSRLTRRDLL